MDNFNDNMTNSPMTDIGVTEIPLLATNDPTGDNNNNKHYDNTNDEKPVDNKEDNEKNQSKTLIHVLRCNYCNFESILRSRFDKHLPCSQQMNTYQLYTCTLCCTCSTSKLIMDEHRRVHHSNMSKTFKITILIIIVQFSNYLLIKSSGF
ncbi:hypothetical protein MN116_007312 [Schistosoma mekongi]|uniref:Uncharacterized protein n=1 Tax=Schistosoma mekongi TaxID=38744 RepID=A0AAE2D3G8_SCHME|nr:hypothetical protein MN116_007312 [Schistosoma mekongi]